MQALADGVIPFSDPLSDRGYYDVDTNNLKYSQYIGVAWREVSITVTGAKAVEGVLRTGSYAVYQSKNVVTQYVIRQNTLAQVTSLSTGIKLIDRTNQGLNLVLFGAGTVDTIQNTIDLKDEIKEDFFSD